MTRHQLLSVLRDVLRGNPAVDLFGLGSDSAVTGYLCFIAKALDPNTKKYARALADMLREDFRQGDTMMPLQVIVRSSVIEGKAATHELAALFDLARPLERAPVERTPAWCEGMKALRLAYIETRLRMPDADLAGYSNPEN
jgi:hypothetical protein